MYYLSILSFLEVAPRYYYRNNKLKFHWWKQIVEYEDLRLKVKCICGPGVGGWGGNSGKNKTKQISQQN